MSIDGRRGRGRTTTQDGVRNWWAGGFVVFLGLGVVALVWHEQASDDAGPTAPPASTAAQQTAAPGSPGGARPGVTQARAASNNGSSRHLDRGPGGRPAPEETHQEDSPLPWADTAVVGMKTLGEPASAQASVEGELFDLSPNQAGIFQRVYVEGGSTITLEIEYPNASAGERVAVQVQDGGRLNDDAVFLVTYVDQLGTISFDFQVTNHPGIHRVSLKKGSDVKTLDFWVGRPLPVAAMLPQAP